MCSSDLVSASTPTPTTVAQSGDARNGGDAIGPGGALGLLIALVLPIAFGAVVAAVSLGIARARMRSRSGTPRD